MGLNSLTVFLTVVEEMNFTRAAERLYITQQSLSGHIKRLEEHYGAALFQRRPTLKLTVAGEALVLCAKQMMESESALERRLADITQNASAALTLGISYQRSGVFFPGIWSQFHRIHPNISIRLHERMTSGLLEELKSNAIDIMVGVDIAESADLTILPLVEERMQCVFNELLLRRQFPDCWRQMLARYGQEGVDLTELRDLPMLLLPSGNRQRANVDRLFRQKRILPQVVLECTQQTVLYHAGCFCGGVAVINPISIYERIRDQRTLPPHCHSFPLQGVPVYTISLAFRKDIPQPQYVLDMAQCIQEEFQYYSDLLELHKL